LVSFYFNIMGKGEACGKGSGEGWGEGEGGGHGKGEAEWKKGLCDCGCSGMGCLTCCCPPVSQLLLAEKLGLEEFQYKYLGLIDFVGGGGLCTMIAAFLTRGKVRERYNIEGSTCGDFMVSCCCLPCSQCQMANHIDESVQ